MQVTEAATAVLKEARTQSGAPPETGIRFRRVAGENAREGVRIEFAEAPVQGDEVIEEQGLRIFVAGDLVDTLSARVLDADMTPSGPQLWFREEPA